MYSMSAMARSQEIRAYLAQSPFAMEQVRGGKSRNSKWGLPDQLYGVEIEVMNFVKATNNKGAASAKGYIWPATTAVLCARPGGLDNNAGESNFLK